MRRQWNDIVKELKECNCQPRFPYPVNIFLSNEGEINICSDKM